MNTPVLERPDLSSWRWTRQHLDLFTDLYLQHDVLLQPSAHNNKKVTQERSAALRSLGAALEPGLEPLAYRTRSIIYMYRCLCRTELRAYIASARWRNDLLTAENILQHTPEWLRRAEDKLHMLPQLIAEGYIKNYVVKPPRAPRSSGLLALANMVRASRGILPITARIDRLEALWDRLRHMSLHKLSRLRRRECDSLWLHEWLAVDVVLLYDHSFSLITEESFQESTQEAELARLLQSVQLLRRRAGPSRAQAAWLEARHAYCMPGCYVSLVLLQRLWSELRARTRRALCPPPPAPASAEPRSAAAIQFYKKVASMYPSVLTEPSPSWRELVAAGDVHEDQYDVGEVIHNIDTKECAEVLDELMERDKDDDIILIEKEIETVELNESSDEESQMVDKNKTPGESEMEALRSKGKALFELQQQLRVMKTQSLDDYQHQVDIQQCPTEPIISGNGTVGSEQTVEQAKSEAVDDEDSVEKSSLVTEESSIALLKKLNPNSCKTFLIFEDDDDDSSDMTNRDDLIDGDTIPELNIGQDIDDNITKDNTDIIERALKVRDALEPVTPTKADISSISTNRNYSDSDKDNLLTDGVKTLNNKTISLLNETIPDDSVSKYFRTNYNETKPTVIPANESNNFNTVINEIISLDSQITPVIPVYVSIDNLVTTSDCQTEIISHKPSDNGIQITKRIQSNVIPADMARKNQMKKAIQEKKIQYRRILPKQDIAIDNQMKKHIKSLENETKISVLQAEIANEKAKDIITNNDKTKTSNIPANDNYNIVISDVKSLVNRNKISNRSLLKPNIANKMTNDIKPRNSNHIIEHNYSQNAECDPDDFSPDNNNKHHTIDNDCDSDNSCELVIAESDSRLKQTDSSIEQCGSQVEQDGSRVEKTDSPIEQGGSHIVQGGSQREQSDSQIDIKPPTTLNEQKTEYDALKYFKYKQSNKSFLVPSETIVSFDNIIPWIRPLNRVIKSEQSGSSVKQSGSSAIQSGSSVIQSGSSVRQSDSGVAMSADSTEDSDDTARSEHSFGSNDSDVEFDIDPKLLQTVSIPLVRCDYLLSRSHINPTPLQFNLTDRHEVNDPKTPQNVSKVNDIQETLSDTDTSDSEADDLVIDSDADYEPSDKTVLYSDVTRGKNERDILDNMREKETDSYFDVAWRNLSADFILNRRNVELLALCRPVSVALERLSGPVGGRREWGDREGHGEGRRQKRVRLSDIEEVRRVNRSLLTAQVAPIAADPAGGDAESGLLNLKQCLERPQRQPNFTDQLQKLQKQQENIKAAVQKERQRLQQEKQERQEAQKCGQQRLREGSKYCCAAKRHRAVNDARRRMYRGNNLAPPRELPLHDFSHKSTNKCTCCCTHLLVKPTQNKPKVKPGPKSKKPRQPIEKEKKRKKIKPTSKSKLRNRKKRIPTPTLEELDEKLKDDLEEWNRQKTINRKYFYISSMMTDKNKATPIDNAAPKNNTTPIDNAALKNNTTPIDNDAPKEYAVPKNNTTPIENTTTKYNAIPIDKPKDNTTPIPNDTLKYNATPKDDATEKATDQTKVSTAPVSHLFHTQSIPIHNKYFHQTTVKLCMNVTNGKTDKPIDEAPSTNTPSLGNPSNVQNIEKPVANATVKPPPPLLPLRVRSDLCAPNQPTTFVNQPLTFVNQPSTSVKQPVTFKNQPASFKNKTASFVNQPATATFINQPAAYVYQPSKFVKQPVTFFNQPVKFVHQHVTTINQPTKILNQLTPTNQPVAPVNQLHFTSTLVPVAFKMMPPKAANTQKFVKIAPKPPPTPSACEKLDTKTCKTEPTDTPSEKQIYNTKENVKLSDNELNQPDGSLLNHMKLSKDKVPEHQDSTKTTKAIPFTEQILIQRALDDVNSMELEPGADETEMKIPALESATSQRRRASCDVIGAVASKRRASDVINYSSSEMTIRPVDKPGPPKVTLEPHKITTKPLTMTEKPRDVTIRSLEVAESQENAKGSREVTNSSNEVKIKIESSEPTNEETSDIELVLKQNSSVMSERKKSSVNSISSKYTGRADYDFDHQAEGKGKDSEIPNVDIQKEEDKSTASIDDSVGQNIENMGQSKDRFQKSGDAIRPSDDIGSSEVNVELIEDTKEESNNYTLWSNDYTEPTDWNGPNDDTIETSIINMETREVNVGPSEYTLVSNEHGLWSSDDAMGQSEDCIGPSGGTAGQSEVIIEPTEMSHSKDSKGQSHVRTEESIDITEDSSNDVAEVFDDVTRASGATNVTKVANVTSQIRVVLKTNSAPTTMTVGVTSQPMALNASNVSKGTSHITVDPTSFTSVVTKLRVHLDAQSTITSTSSGTASNMAASTVVETAPSNKTCDITRSSDSSDVEEISEIGPRPHLPPLSIRVGDLHMLPPVRARDLAGGRDPTQLSVHRVDLSRDPMLLQRCYLLVTEHDIPCRDPTYFYIGPKNEARMILFEDDVRPPSVKRHKKSKIQVKEFARVGAGNAYNSISVGGAAVPAERASPADLLLGAAPDRLTAGAGNLFQKITNEPLVYAQVHTVVQSLRRARHLLLQEAPLAVLNTASGETYPLLRDVSLRPVGLSCAVPGALHDLVDRLNAQSNEAIAQRSMKTFTVPDSDED